MSEIKLVSEAQNYINTTLHSIADEYRVSSSPSQRSPIPITSIHRPSPSLPPDSSADISGTASASSTGVNTTVSSTVPSAIGRPNSNLTANPSPAAVVTNQSKQSQSRVSTPVQVTGSSINQQPPVVAARTIEEYKRGRVM